MWILFLRARYMKRELRKIITQLGGEISLLDAGFGYGQYSLWLAENYPQAKLTSAEIEPVMIDDFQELVKSFKLENISLEEIDLTQMSYDSKFDLAVSVDVMEHILEDQLVFDNIHKSLKPGGVFVMHTPHIRKSALRGKGAFVGEHVRDGYSTAELLGKLNQAGFDKLEYLLTYGKYGALAWKILQKYPIMTLQKSKLLFLLLPFYLILIYPLAEILMRLDLDSSNVEGDGILVKAWKKL